MKSQREKGEKNETRFEQKTHLSRRKKNTVQNGLLVCCSLFDFIHNNKMCYIKYLHILLGANQALHIMAWQLIA